MPSKAHSHQTVSETVEPMPNSEAWEKVTTVIEVIVQHRDTDSFSRSVDPAAKRYLSDPAKIGSALSATLVNGSRYAAETQYAARDPKPWLISFIRAEVVRTRRRETTVTI